MSKSDTEREWLMEIKMRRLAELVPYAANAKKHDARQVANVAESIRQFGFVQPVVVDRDGVIVIGHCRALAAEKLGMVEVPCVCVDDLTPEQVNALRLVDNKTNESPWDLDLLADELPGRLYGCGPHLASMFDMGEVSACAWSARFPVSARTLSVWRS